MTLHRVGLLMALPVVLTGCDLINEGRDILDGLTNPLVAEVIVLGITLPEGTQDIDFPEEFSDGAGVTAFLADAADVADLANAPIAGATVRVGGETLTQATPGAYVLEPGALAYSPGGSWDFSAAVGSGDPASASIDLAPAATFQVPQTHPAGTALSVDLSGQEFDGAFLIVIDSNGDITYDNRPADIMGVYELGRGEPAGVEEIPGDAFPSAGAYAVGIAGIRSTVGRDNMDRMNTVLSTMMSGNLVFTPVAVTP